jgi:hypothetical protein
LFKSLGLSKDKIKIDFGKVPRFAKYNDVNQEELRGLANIILKLGTDDNILGSDSCEVGSPDYVLAQDTASVCFDGDSDCGDCTGVL